MPINPQLEQGENLLGNFEYVPEPEEKLWQRQAPPLALAVTSQALLIAREQVFGSQRDWAVERVPLSEVRQMRIEPLRPYFWYVLALLMISIGGAGTFALLTQDLRRGVTIDAWPVSALVIGCALPFAARRRHALVIERAGGAFRWHPSFVTAEGARRRDQFLSAVGDAMRRAGVIVVDHRSPALPSG